MSDSTPPESLYTYLETYRGLQSNPPALNPVVEKGPAYSILTVNLQKGESINAEPGSLMCMSSWDDVKMTTSRSRTGLFASFATKFLGDESFFMNTYECVGDKGFVMLAPSVIGDIARYDFTNADRGIFMVPGTFFARMGNVHIPNVIKWNTNAFVGGGNVAFIHATKRETDGAKQKAAVWMTSFGAIKEITVHAGQTVVVDNHHLVAYEDTLTFRTKGSGSIKSFVFGGEGLTLHFTAKKDGDTGKVWMCTRNFDHLVERISQALSTSAPEEWLSTSAPEESAPEE